MSISNSVQQLLRDRPRDVVRWGMETVIAGLMALAIMEPSVMPVLVEARKLQGTFQLWLDRKRGQG